MADFPALDRLDRFGRELQARQAEMSRVAEQVSEITTVAEAASGLVRVTVGAGGQVKGITIDPRAMRLGSETLAEELLAACEQASATYAAEVKALADQAFGLSANGDGDQRPSAW